MEVHTFDTLYQCKKLGVNFPSLFAVIFNDYKDCCSVLITIQFRPILAAFIYVLIPLKIPDSIGFLEHVNSWYVELFLPLSDSLGTLTAHQNNVHISYSFTHC